MELDFIQCLEDSLNQLPSDVVSLPWETGAFKQIFGRPQVCPDVSESLHRPLYHEPPAITVAVETSDNKRSKSTVRLVAGWVDIVRSGADQHWEEERDSKMQVALKRWLDACLAMPQSVGLKRLLDETSGVQNRLRLMRNLLWRKSPATLVKRINSLNRYLMFLGEHCIEFPGAESDLYFFLTCQQDLDVPPTRLQAILESLRFVQHVLEVPELNSLTTSRRCAGAASAKKGGPKRQASPFKVTELVSLHQVVCTDTENVWDRVFAGCILAMVYSRSRWMDLQHAESLIVDRDDSGRLRFLEFTISDHKCSQASVFRNTFLHAIAPCDGVVVDDWADQWLSCRKTLDLEVGKLPVMPAPNSEGEATKRPLSTSEMKLWAIHLLQRAGHDLGNRRISSHSCKTTMLSYASKFGLPWEDRLILGGHVGHLRSAVTYSRDALAGPLRKLSTMIEAICLGRFMPDNTRSGRFLQGTSESVEFSFSDKSWNQVDERSFLAASNSSIDEASKGPVSIVISDEEEVKNEAIGGLVENDIAVDSSSSSDEDLGCTSSSSDEEAGAECPGQRMVRAPTTPNGFSLIQHSKLKTLHLLENGFEKVLVCGRSISSMHKSIDLSVRWDTPCCHNCWRKIALL